MKLRTKLIVALIFLAILPLSAVVLYSYHSSIAAFRAVVEDASQHQAESMNERMARVREDLDQFLTRATQYRFASQPGQENQGQLEAAELEALRAEAKKYGQLVDTCEFIPAACEDESKPPEIPAPPKPGQLPEERFVFIADWIHPKPKTDAVHHENSQLPPPPEDHDGSKVVSALLSTGAELVADAIQNPEAFEEKMDALEQKGDEISITIQTLFNESGEIINKAVEDSTDIEIALGAEGERIRKIVLQHIPPRLRLTERELAQLEERRKKAEALLGREYTYEVKDGGEIIGMMRADVSAPDVLNAVLNAARRSEGEIPFAIGADNTVYTLDSNDSEIISQLGIMSPETEPKQTENWIVVDSKDPISGTTFGIARPLGTELEEIRKTAVYNMLFGVALIGFAGIGIMPLSSRMTRHLKTLTHAADTLATGNLSTRVPVHSRDEFGILATAFNRMAEDLEEQQKTIRREEGLRREQEIENGILDRENQRRRIELEAARDFQLSLLPVDMPCCKGYDIAVSTCPATEVGGDYYDFREGSDGITVLALGDATGHGAAAGTMVTAAKSLFTSSSELRPQDFLTRSAEVFRTMRLGRMSIAMALAQLHEDGLTVSMAGMPPLLVYRAATGAVDEFVLPGLPLGSFRGNGYRETHIHLEEGDTAVLMSDGLPELLDTDHEPLGYERVRTIFAEIGSRPPEEIIESFHEHAKQYRGEHPQADDITFVVLRKT